MSKGIEFISVKLSCEEAFIEIVVAELGELGYNSMMETDAGVEGYIEEKNFNEQDINDLISRYSEVTTITYEVEEVVSRNWNEEWEKNYDPISVDKSCLVRATFHKPDPSFKYEIIINPRMSFGTGHHATTYLMLKTQMELDHADKRVLDAGCGTAILAVMAEKLGAKEVIAYDNNSWSTENAPENVELNECKNITVKEGTIATLGLEGTFDIILANINKNVLLDEMESYSTYLHSGSTLVLSGFYDYDKEDIVKRADSVGLEFRSQKDRNSWVALVFIKK
ncbi:50S ribosomal protein L11 methyltransferase [Fulvivirga sediminis]|uniref:50S ribosomal protein L11 methyltransferase n=1 Tax=Fulvivirga sediminis TaxID=2803949 RepID=UPI001F00DF0A|nr:50S ribosomal protein L11 methyltransferase [Fulvivirga sediminis]